MKKRLGVGLLVLGAMVPAGGAVTLEELAARLEVLEKKVEAYEERFGPLEEAPAPGRGGRGAEGATSSGGAKEVLPAAGGGSLAGASDEASIDGMFGVGDSTGAVSTGGGWWERTTLGGYGEMHLNLVSGGDNEIDFHRWVLFLNHRFNERITLNSEVELEHSLAGEGAAGEFELEQAYIDIALGKGLHTKAGLFIVPVGFLNETHEPETFFGVERNPIEREIIPTTWWEGGVALSQTLESGFSWDLAVHSGLNVPTSGSNAYRIRSGREKVSEAPANEPAVTARVRYNGIPGVDVSVFGNYQNDLTQGSGTEDNSALMLGAAASLQRGGFGLRGVIAGWDIDGDLVEELDRDRQWGFFVEPSYTHRFENGSKVGVFGRWNWYEYARGEVDQYDVGLNYWPIDNVVFKADYARIVPDGGNAEDVVNFGVGYSF